MEKPKEKERIKKKKKEQKAEKPFNIEDYTLSWDDPQDHFSLMMNGYIPEIYPKPFR